MSGDRGVPVVPAAEESAASPAAVLAGRLREELSHAGISATVGAGFGLALVTAVGRVNIWVEDGPRGWRFRWWTGQMSPEGRRVYTWCPASAVETAARRVGGRVRQVRREALTVARVGRAGGRARASVSTVRRNGS